MSIRMRKNTAQRKNSDHSNMSFKLLVLGDSRIGKTSILERYVNRTFKENYLVTIGVDIRIKRLIVNDKNLDIYITDTAGEERFRCISKMSYKGANGILVGFALNDEKTLESVNYWIEQIYENKGKDSNVSLVLFGNKCDDKEHLIPEEEVQKINAGYKLKYFSTSAKDNTNIQELFEYLIKDIIMKKGFLNNINSIDDIKIAEREKDKNEYKKNEKIKKPKKKSFC